MLAGMKASSQMHAERREQTIMSMIEKGGFVSSRELDQCRIASAATVRRDLERLANAGRIVRVHGGAKMPDSESAGLSGVPFRENVRKNAAAKAEIGRAAAALCSAGESIIIDGGTTTLQMCPHLGGLELQVVTNSLHIVTALSRQPKTRIYMPAGALFREQNILLSPFEDDGTAHYKATKMFIGAAGVSPAGLLQTDVILLQAERRLMARASSVVLMVDSSKFKSQVGQALCALDDIDTVITDDGITPKDARMIKKAGVKLLVVKLK
jgi:DeoR family transcriptional regulator, ulaG and ulaABCDEF operon transcriptional repressor